MQPLDPEGRSEEKYDYVFSVNPERFIREMERILPQKEIDILYLLWKEKQTLRSIGERYHISRERIRQINMKSMRKLLAPAVKARYRTVTLHEYRKLESQYKEIERNYQDSLRAKEGDPSATVNFSTRGINELDVSTRTYNCLLSAGYENLGDLSGVRTSTILNIRNMGVKSLQELICALKANQVPIIEDV